MRAVKYAKALQPVQLGWEVGEAHRDLRVNIGSRRERKIFDGDREQRTFASPARPKIEDHKKVKSPFNGRSQIHLKLVC